MPSSTERLVWIDLEMTGLNPDTDRIIEIATIVTDLELNVVRQGPVFAINQDDDILMSMDRWNTHTHNETGLVQRVQESEITESIAEKKTLEFLSGLVKKNTSPLCGNTICQDRRFLFRHMPKLEAFLHYRNIDVSTIKELSDYWFPGFSREFSKKNTHQALNDIIESIEELKFYRKHLLSKIVY